MKNEVSFADLTKPLERFIKRFHTLLFFLLVSLGLFAAIMSLMTAISISSTTASSSDHRVNGTFDETTIQLLKSRSSNSIAQPGNRPSPFVE